MSADDTTELPDDGYKYNPINGVVVMSPRPLLPHQRGAMELFDKLGIFTKTPHGEGCVVLPDIDVRFAADLVYCSDVIVFRAGRKPTGHRVTTTPDLIIEILSPGSEALDLKTKRADYERFGVPEYWIADIEAASVRVLRLVNAGYVETTESAGHLASSAIQGFQLDLENLRAIMRSA